MVFPYLFNNTLLFNGKMKILLARLAATALLFSSISNPVSAQDVPAPKKNVVGLSVFGLHNKVKLKYERVFVPHLSAGVLAAAYYGIYPGVQVSPFVRLYGKPAPRGLYGQVQAGFYRHSVTYTYNTAGPGPQYTETERFSHSGVGAAVGYQWLLGRRKNIAVDINGGLKVYNTGNAQNDRDLTTLYWFTEGPGSYFNGLINLGYAF